MTNVLFLDWGFSPKLGFFIDFFLTKTLISPRGNYIEMGGGAQRPFLHVNEPKKTGARSAQARRGQKLLVGYKKVYISSI
jgi:hypothetical protein